MMKQRKDLIFFSVRSIFKDGLITPAMVTLGNSIELPALAKRLGFRLLSAAAPRKVKYSSRLRQLMTFTSMILNMVKHHGSKTTVMYLKACQLAVQKRIAGDKIKSLRDLQPDLPLPRLTTSKLPRVIPLRDRRLICSGSPFVIRWGLTLFSIYRVISIPGQIKLGTITSGFSGVPKRLGEISDEISLLTKFLSDSGPKRPEPKARLLFLETGSPNVRVSGLGGFSDLVLMPDELYQLLHAYAIESGFHSLIAMMELLREASHLPGLVNKEFQKEGNPKFGSLQTKEEAAGKIRVFAMVDVWTQSLLRPLHDYLFSILKSLPNDGTFDQQASVNRCFEKSKASGCSFGYDLSAATDRLPLALQIAVLTPLIGEKLSILGSKVLVQRDYGLKDEPIRYSVGQPMGAYSSGAMLALTHHLLVQLASRYAGVTQRGGYVNYELLGDDINIFDKNVAQQYLRIMEDIGVPINLSKSVVASNDSFEFAKVTGFKGHNVSAVSGKAFISQNSLMGRVNICYSLGHRIQPVSFMTWFKRVTRASKYTEGSDRYPLLAAFSMFANSSKIPFTEVFKAFYDLENPYVKGYRKNLFNARIEYVKTLLGSMLHPDRILNFSKNKVLSEIWNIEEMGLRIALNRKVVMFRHEYSGKTAEDFAKALCCHLTNNLIPEHVMTLSGDNIERGDLTEQQYNALYQGVGIMVNSEFERHMQTVVSSVGMDSPLEEIFDQLDRQDRFREFLQVIDRSKEKLAAVPSNKTGQKIIDAPLSKIKILLDSRKGRPDGTFSALQKDRLKETAESRVLPKGFKFF